jgi:hypothetical protein
MKTFFTLFVSLSVLLSACGTATVAPTPTQVPLPTETAVLSATLQPPTITPSPLPNTTVVASLGGYGPSNFPVGVNPLTGLQVASPALLDRRPLLIKVSNLPRNVRPQWGLSLADIVFEYYTEEGATRFAALFLGNDASTVGPIRSARFMDLHIIRGYKAVFAFGSAYDKVIERLYNAEFANRLVLEGPATPLKRYDPNGADNLVVSTSDLSAYITAQGIENGRQNLDGMSFNPTVSAGGQLVTQVFVRYSGVIYNRWDYDNATGKYLRYADTANDYDNVKEQYAQLTDRLTGQPVAFDNLVVLFVTTDHYNISPEVVDIQFLGSGTAYAFRDGQGYPVTWQRNSNSVVSLTNPDGTPFSFKPGTTWFEVMGASSIVQQTGQVWRFVHRMP